MYSSSSCKSSWRSLESNYRLFFMISKQKFVILANKRQVIVDKFICVQFQGYFMASLAKLYVTLIKINLYRKEYEGSLEKIDSTRRSK
jgi:hypothetical protein